MSADDIEEIELPDPDDPTTPFPFELPSADWEFLPRDLSDFRRWCEHRVIDLRRLPASLGFDATVFGGKAAHDAWLFATSFGIQVPMPPRFLAPHSALEFLAVCLGRCAEKIGPVIPASPPKPPQQAKPRWDGETRTLYLGDLLIKRYNRGTAVNQIDVIEAFQNAGWPAVIDDPFNNPRRLNQTLRSLKDSLPADTIRFRGDGTGDGVTWEYAT